MPQTINKIEVGPLDQGYWPDGLLTPPCEEAIRQRFLSLLCWLLFCFFLLYQAEQKKGYFPVSNIYGT